MSYNLPYRGLPLELREMIYEALLCPPGGLVIARKRDIERYQVILDAKRPCLPMNHLQFPDCSYIDPGNTVCMARFPHTTKAPDGDVGMPLTEFSYLREFYPASYEELRCENPPNLNILLTCHEVRSEASAFLGRNLFEFKDVSPVAELQFLQNLPSAALDRIHSVIHGRAKNYFDGIEMEPDATALNDVLTFLEEKPRIRNFQFRKEGDANRTYPSPQLADTIVRLIFGASTLQTWQFCWDFQIRTPPEEDRYLIDTQAQLVCTTLWLYQEAVIRREGLSELCITDHDSCECQCSPGPTVYTVNLGVDLHCFRLLLTLANDMAGDNTGEAKLLPLKPDMGSRRYHAGYGTIDYHQDAVNSGVSGAQQGVTCGEGRKVRSRDNWRGFEGSTISGGSLD